MDAAIKEQTSKLAGYNIVEYGSRIACLPVYSAAGSWVEFGVVDVRFKTYRRASRFDISQGPGRCACFVGALNIFRFLRTMAPHIPNNPSPIFRVVKDLTFYEDYVVKKIPVTCTCPEELYALLATGSVPCAVKVVKNGGFVLVSPVGVQTPDKGEGLELAEVRSAIKSCLMCLQYMHARNFVHRDIRWANLIRLYKFRTDGSVESVNFFVIDFEFSGRSDEPMNIYDYIFRDVVSFGQPYYKSYDLYFVGELIVTWAQINGVALDSVAQDLVKNLQNGLLNTETAQAHPWLA